MFEKMKTWLERTKVTREAMCDLLPRYAELVEVGSEWVAGGGGRGIGVLAPLHMRDAAVTVICVVVQRPRQSDDLHMFATVALPGSLGELPEHSNLEQLARWREAMAENEVQRWALAVWRPWTAMDVESDEGDHLRWAGRLVEVDGSDEEDCMEAMIHLINNRFGEAE